MMDVRNAISNILDRFTLKHLAEVTLQRLRRDGLLPPVLELIQHLQPGKRSKASAATAAAPAPEPEFMI
jgi:hypothetical protein